MLGTDNRRVGKVPAPTMGRTFANVFLTNLFYNNLHSTLIRPLTTNRMT
jgi:hypothetical protein